VARGTVQGIDRLMQNVQTGPFEHGLPRKKCWLVERLPVQVTARLLASALDMSHSDSYEWCADY